MYKSIILAFVVVFFVAGLVCFISFLLLKAACPDKESRFFILCPFYCGDKECTVRISCVLSIITALGLHKRCIVLAVDNGMDENEKKMLYAAFFHADNVKICSKEEISDLLEEKPHKVP